MFLKYTLKEIEKIQTQTKYYEAVREAMTDYGLDYASFTSELSDDVGSRKLVSIKELEGYISDDKTTFELDNIAYALGLWAGHSQVYSLESFFKSSNIDKTSFIHWLAYVANSKVLNSSTASNLKNDSGKVLFDSLPVGEIYLKPSYFNVDTTYLNPDGLAKSARYSHIREFNTLDFSAKQNYKNFAGHIKYYISSRFNIAVQDTKSTYTQVSGSDVKSDSMYTDTIDFENSYFTTDWSNELHAIPTDTDELLDTLKEKENYALQIESNAEFKSTDIQLNPLLKRLSSACYISGAATGSSKLVTRGLTYKIVFDIASNKIVYVDSTQLYTALVMLLSTGTETIRFYYDSDNDNVVVKGKDYKYEVVVSNPNERFSKETKTEVIPTFSIIESQPVDEVTALLSVEYLEFYDTSVTFKQKYDILNQTKRAGLDLSDEFKLEYSGVAANYENQIAVGNSNDSLSSKYVFAEEIMNTYLESYTAMVTENGASYRTAKPRDSWMSSGYVYRVEEAYWKYNRDITLSELLAYFVSKGNKSGYRTLCLKLLGIDYWLFYDAIINELLKEQSLYISKLDIDEEEFTADVQYVDAAGFISGDIYVTEEYVVSERYKENIKIFFGEELGLELQSKAEEVIVNAVNDRFTPEIKPKATGNSEEDEAISLNIDLHCPIFYDGSMNQRGSNVKFSKANITGRRVASFPIRTKSGQNSTSYDAGIIKLFSDWVSSNPSQIVGGYTSSEIYDGYIMPLQNTEYMYHYVLPRFQDKSGNVVGINGIRNPKWKISDIQKNLALESKIALQELGLISNINEITKSEAREVKKELLLEMKERLWDVKREGRRLFNQFLKTEVDTNSVEEIQDRWNKKYNNYSKPNLNKQPIFVTHNILFGSKKKPMNFNLRQAQIEGLKHVSSRGNSGLLLHEVGFGKTTTSITQVNQLFNTGDAKRALFLVPNSVYDKFGEEILGTSVAHGLFPNANVVWLDNARLDSIKNLKVYSDDEISAIEKYGTLSDKKKDTFLRKFPRIVSSLKKGRIVLKDDPEYTDESSYTTFIKRLKLELENTIPQAKKIPFIYDRFDGIKLIYDEIKERAEKAKEEAEQVLNYPASTDTEKKKAQEVYNKELKSLSSALEKDIYDYILVIGNSLTDELGYYKPEVMRDNTIIIAKHSAVRQLRPSNQAIHRALNFKYGKKMPSQAALVESSKREDWSMAFGGIKSEYLSGYKIATTHPVSLDKLNVDAVVVDEIHNFNNIVGNVVSMGIAADRGGSTSSTIDTLRVNPDYTTFTRTTKGSKRKGSGRGAESVPTLEYRKKAGNSTNYADIRMASSWKAADKNKLNLAAICFDIQYKNSDSTNVLLLSATPFTDHPLQVLSVLGMTNYRLLERSGISSSFDFFINYVDEVYKYGIRHDETFGLFVEIDRYYNDKALSNLITNISNVKITDAEIEKSRPVKAVIPQNKIKESEDGVAQTYDMGTYFDELVDVSSKVTLNDAQKKMKQAITEYLEDDSDTRNIYELFPYAKTSTESEDKEVDEDELDEIIKEAIKKAKEEPNSAELEAQELEFMLFEDEYRDHPKIISAIKKIKKIAGVEDTESDEDSDDVSGKEARLSGISSEKRVAAKAISCQAAQEALVISPYLVPVGYKGVHKNEWLPDLESDPAKVFVENSPKLLFTAKSIENTIAYQKEQLAKGEISKIGGQVVYFNKFNFTFGGKRYNAFNLFAEYLVRFVDGISDEKFESTSEYKEIGIIAGAGVRDKNKTKTTGKGKNKKEVIVKRGKTLLRDQFNNGEILVLLGSKSIKEGIDLQGNAHTMYICQSEFSPTVAMQLEGRIWRQKNPYDNVRIAYVLALNSIDSFIYDKLNKKVNNIKRMLEAGVYEMNTTQFTIDTRERLLELITDVDKLTQLEYSEQKKVLSDESNRLTNIIALLKLIESKYEELMDKIDRYLPTMQEIYDGVSQMREDEHRDDIRKELERGRKPEMQKKVNKLKADLAKEFEELSDEDKASYVPTGGVKPSLKGYIEANQSKIDAIKDSYKAKDEEIQEIFEQSDWENPVPKLESPLDKNTPYSTLDQVARTTTKILADYVKRAVDVLKGKNPAEQVELLSDKGKTIKYAKLWMNTSIGQESVIDYTDSEGVVHKVFEDYYGSSSVTSPTDVAGRIQVLIIGGDNPRLGLYASSFQNSGEDSNENASILSAYQEYVRSDDKNRSVSELVKEAEVEKNAINENLSNPEEYKKQIRENWIKVIEKRQEKEDFDIDSVVKSFSKSNELLKLR